MTFWLWISSGHKIKLNIGALTFNSFHTFSTINHIEVQFDSEQCLLIFGSQLHQRLNWELSAQFDFCARRFCNARLDNHVKYFFFLLLSAGVFLFRAHLALDHFCALLLSRCNLSDVSEHEKNFYDRLLYNSGECFGDLWRKRTRMWIDRRSIVRSVG